MGGTSRRLVSCLIVFHFSAIGLTYSANWQRSAIQDRLLVLMQPYLIGLNWYQEMLPAEWISEANRSRTVRVSIQTRDAPNEWQAVLDSSRKGWSGAKTAAFLHPLVEFALSENVPGLNDLFKSMLVHLESDGNHAGKILRIRLGRASDSESEMEKESVLYEASVARFPNGEFGFIPKIESHRELRSRDPIRGTP